jgi:hypothetical protein
VGGSNINISHVGTALTFDLDLDLYNDFTSVGAPTPISATDYFLFTNSSSERKKVGADYLAWELAGMTDFSDIGDIPAPTADLYFNRNAANTAYEWATASGGSMVYPSSAGLAYFNGTSWGTSITDNSTDWNTAFDNHITGVSVTGTDIKTITLTQQDGGSISDNFTDLSESIWTPDTYGITYQVGNIGIGVASNVGDFMTIKENSGNAALKAYNIGSGYGIYSSTAGATAVYATGGNIKANINKLSANAIEGINPANTGTGMYGNGGQFGVYGIGGTRGGVFEGGVDSFDGYLVNGFTAIDGSGFARPVNSTDSSAPNNSLYYSTTQNRLVYKTSAGVVIPLY